MKKYYFDKENKKYICEICGKGFEEGEVFDIDGRFFQAEKAVQKHIDVDHKNYIVDNIYSDSKYNTLTDKQKELFECFYKGLSDKEVAKKLNVSTSTVRHQRFTFREKAKQARYYLDLYNSVFADDNPKEKLMPIKHDAKYVDDRYIVTEEEKENILSNAFESLIPLKLKHFPVKAKKQYVILTRIAQELDPSKKYSEKEINDTLAEIYHDYVLIRRFLVDYGFMNRNQRGTEYEMTSSY